VNRNKYQVKETYTGNYKKRKLPYRKIFKHFLKVKLNICKQRSVISMLIFK